MQTVLLHLGVEGRAGHPQEPGGMGLISPGPPQRLGEEPPFRFGHELLVDPLSRAGCKIAGDAFLTSPISSKKMVPPSACSNLPIRRAAAPVKAPRS